MHQSSIILYSTKKIMFISSKSNINFFFINKVWKYTSVVSQVFKFKEDLKLLYECNNVVKYNIRASTIDMFVSHHTLPLALLSDEVLLSLSSFLNVVTI